MMLNRLNQLNLSNSTSVFVRHPWKFRSQGHHHGSLCAMEVEKSHFWCHGLTYRVETCWNQLDCNETLCVIDFCIFLYPLNVNQYVLASSDSMRYFVELSWRLGRSRQNLRFPGQIGTTLEHPKIWMHQAALAALILILTISDSSCATVWSVCHLRVISGHLTGLRNLCVDWDLGVALSSAWDGAPWSRPGDKLERPGSATTLDADMVSIWIFKHAHDVTWLDKMSERDSQFTLLIIPSDSYEKLRRCNSGKSPTK